MGELLFALKATLEIFTKDFLVRFCGQQQLHLHLVKKKKSELRILPWAWALRIQVADSSIQQDTDICPSCPIHPTVTMVRCATVDLPMRLPRLHAGNMLLGGHTPGKESLLLLVLCVKLLLAGDAGEWLGGGGRVWLARGSLR